MGCNAVGGPCNLSNALQFVEGGGLWTKLVLTPLPLTTLFVRRAVWGTCRIVEYCRLCIVDLKTEAHVNCIEITCCFFFF